MATIKPADSSNPVVRPVESDAPPKTPTTPKAVVADSDRRVSTPPSVTTAPGPAGLKLAPPQTERAVARQPEPTAARAQALIAEVRARSAMGGVFDFDLLAKNVAAEPEPARSKLVLLVLGELGYADTDDFARGLENVGGIAGLQALSHDARQAIVRAVRQGVITEQDRQIYNALAKPLRDESFAAEKSALRDPTQRSAMRERFKKLLGEGRSVVFDGTAISAPKAATSQWGIDFFYRHVVEKPAPLPYVSVPFSSPADVVAVMQRPLAVSAKTGKPVHLEGTTLYRPGLGNVPPSPANLFRIAQHADKVVLMYAFDDGTKASELRALDDYNGTPVPPELKGKLFAVGRPDRVLQTARAGTGVLIEQLERVHQGAQRFGLNLDSVTAIAHSQGNIEVALARLVLAAHGHNNVINRHIALSPAVRGSLVADSSPVFDLIGWASASFDGAARNAINDLDPDAVAAILPEFLRTTVDLSVLGLTSGPKGAAYEKWLMHWTAPLAEDDLEGTGGDGMVDRRVSDFVRDPKKFVLTEKRYDHLSMIVDPDAVDAWLPLVEPVAPEADELLGVIARNRARGI